jgi:membrane protein DedA with SNARE-associated domain
MNVSHLVAEYGYLAVFVLVITESFGLPLPGETALIAAGVFAGHSHVLSVWWIWAVASTACIVGGSIGFLVGDRGGYRLVRRFGSKIRLDDAKLKVGRYAFARHGAKIVFFGRFVTVVRTYAALLAGVNKMRWRRFALANAGGGIVWSGIYAFVSYGAGNALAHLSGTINLVLVGATVVTVIVVVLLVRHKTSQLVEVAEAAYPGPLE